MKVTVLIDNQARPGWVSEHGLALVLELPEGLLLFDTGAGAALPKNLTAAGVDISRIRWCVLSHGHFDHTGGLAYLLAQTPKVELYHGSGVERVRYSLHPERPVKALTMPADAMAALKALPQEHVHTVACSQAVLPGLVLTGPIPRESFEDCGGPFFTDQAGTSPDRLEDEIALLTQSGTLIQGCCHAGIINTVEHCKRSHPDIRIRTILGGLHLLHASEERLEKTADYLNALNLDRLILLHCTGEGAVACFKQRLNCEVILGKAGEVYNL